MSDEISKLDATAQAELVRRGEVKPMELVDAAIRRIEDLNPKLNAVNLPLFDYARAHVNSGLPEGPFRGVPFLLKDIGANMAGFPLHCGMRLLRDANHCSDQDSYMALRFRDAGFVFVGKTNTPELAIAPVTEPEAYGPSRSAWSLEHSPGGSSGGAGAAVAAGIVPVAHASDGGGSIRIPAAHSGLVGLKPSRGRVSFGPELGERWQGFSCEHVVTRSVRDCAAILDVTHGFIPGDPYTAPAPKQAYLSEVGADPGRLRIGFMAGAPRGLDLHADCAAAVTHAASLLGDLGHEVEVSHPDALDDGLAPFSFARIVMASTARALDSWGTKVGREVGPEDVERLTWELALRGREISGPDYLEAIQFVHAFGRRVHSWYAGGFDLLLTPTCAKPPPEIGEVTSTEEEPLRGYVRAAPYGMFTLSFNMTGQPGISLPLYWNETGLPIGVQLVAPFGREDLLFRVAAQLEDAQPWRDREPPLHA